MPDDVSPPEADDKSLGLDLSSLGGLSLGPNWGTGSMPPSKTPNIRGGRDDRSGGRSGFGRDDRRGPSSGGPGARPDRRGGKTDRRSGPGGASGSPHPGQGGSPQGRAQGHGPSRGQGHGPGRRFERRHEEPPFEPVLTGDFYPDDNAFKALTNAIKHSCRTFELFEIARLILEKPERWVCVAKHPEQKEGEPAILYASVPDGLPFTSEQAALNHVFTHYLDTFFTIEEYEADPPTGSFQLVHRCGMTGEIIAPPNFHRYQALLREHHANHLAHVPFERVQERLESVREQEAIDSWLEKMKHGRRYILKDPQAETPSVTIPDLEAARLYLLTHAKEKLVRPAYSVRFLGRDLQLLPTGDILRRSLEAIYQQQLRFPLETANNLRGRLRRLHLSVYKRGSKGVSYVCAVKRRFREPGEVMAENLSDLISFIEAHQNVKASELPHQYLGVSVGETDEAPALASPELEPETPVSELAADAASVDTSSPKAEGEATATPEVAAQASESNEAPAATESISSAPEVPEVMPIAAPPMVKNEAPLIALKRDLRYLVSQGYVIEFSDGRLQVPPAKEAPKPSAEPKAKKDKSSGAALAPSKGSESVPSADATTEVPGAEEVVASTAVEPVLDSPSELGVESPPVASNDEALVEESAPVTPVVPTEPGSVRPKGESPGE